MEIKPEYTSGVDISGKKYTNLLNEKNLDLWKDLVHKYSIEVDENNEGEYLTYFCDEIVVIEVDIHNPNPAAFTHELLHLYLKTEGVQIVRDLKKKITGDGDLTEIFSTSLRVHIGNCLEHVKMLPLFLSHGFKNEEFIQDYNMRIIDEEQMHFLEQYYWKDGKTERLMADSFIGKFFAMKASNNPSFDYSGYYQRFEKLDHNLYEIHQRFWEAWKEYQVGEPEVKYIIILQDYLEGLKVWKKVYLK